MATKIKTLPAPSFFDASNADKIRMIDYEGIVRTALEMRKQYGVTNAITDKLSIGVMPIDLMNTFCIPGAQLFVAGRSGRGAVDDNIRFAKFVYKYAGILSYFYPTIDTHTMYQIFHSAFWVNAKGEHPAPYTTISVEDVQNGVWKVSLEAAAALVGGAYAELQSHALHYVRELKAKGRYELTIWPFHGILGGVSHALVSIIEEALWYHAALRGSQTDFRVKGGSALSESYSVLGAEVRTTPGENGKLRPFLQKEVKFIDALWKRDRLIIPGQAKSHCLAWTVDDFLNEINAKDPKLAKRVYLLEDCTSPVVVPGKDYTPEADAAFAKFAEAGMHIVKSTTPIEDWPDFL